VQIKFKHNDDAFWQTLQFRVNSYFKDNGISPFYNTKMLVKIIVMLSLFIGPLCVILFAKLDNWINFILCFILGLSMAGIGLAISHQAVHNAIFKTKRMNRIFGLTFNMLGMSDYIWKIKHNVFHHTYTNVFVKDEALKEGDLIRMSEDAPLKKIHKYQHLYSFFIYAIFTIFWAFALDFEKLFRYKRDGSEINNKKHSWKEYLLFIVTKIYYISLVFILPYFVFHFSVLEITIGFLTMHIIASLIVTHVLQVEHLIEETVHETPDTEGKINQSWAVVQLHGTSNFKTNNWLIEWYLGGSNYQIEHHLFPKICAIHYPEISKIIKETANEFELQYHLFDSFPQAIKAHYTFLKKLGQNPSNLTQLA
jgi:linoleoyl-CoA desaturase